MLYLQISDITDIVVTCGSGGTAAGLCIANHLTGSKVKSVPAYSCLDIKVLREWYYAFIFSYMYSHLTMTEMDYK